VQGLRPYKQFSTDTLKILGVGKVYEASPARTFYVSKPNANELVNYHAEVPGHSNACIAQITLPSSYSEDEAKQIAMSLAAT
jgi:hypothetical protein